MKASLRHWKAEQQLSEKFQGVSLQVKQVKGMVISE